MAAQAGADAPGTHTTDWPWSRIAGHFLPWTLARRAHWRGSMDAVNSIMRWEMYGPGTAIAFSANAEPTGLRVILKRDGVPILSSPAFDTPMMFRLSQDLRAQLTALGFGATPVADCVSVLEGGPCWGPAAPLQSSLFASLR